MAADISEPLDIATDVLLVQCDDGAHYILDQATLVEIVYGRQNSATYNQPSGGVDFVAGRNTDGTCDDAGACSFDLYSSDDGLYWNDRVPPVVFATFESTIYRFVVCEVEIGDTITLDPATACTFFTAGEAGTGTSGIDTELAAAVAISAAVACFLGGFVVVTIAVRD